MEVYYFTAKGKREQNQDSLLLNNFLVNNISLDKVKKYTLKNKILNKFFISDGMGGYTNGELASKIILEKMNTRYRNYSKELIASLLNKTKEFLDYSVLVQHLPPFGGTIAGVIFSSNKNIIFNVGDTRVYKISKNQITLLSKDHSLAQNLIEDGVLNEHSLNYHPSRNILTSSLFGGDYKNISQINYNEFDLKKNEILLLCTDGVWEQFNNETLSKIFNSKIKFEKKIEKLYCISKNNPKDNISFIAIKK